MVRAAQLIGSQQRRRQAAVQRQAALRFLSQDLQHTPTYHQSRDTNKCRERGTSQHERRVDRNPQPEVVTAGAHRHLSQDVLASVSASHLP